MTDLEVYLLGEGTQQRLDDKLGVSIYEVHLGSWRRKGNNEWLTYRDRVTGLFGQQRALATRAAAVRYRKCDRSR